MCLTVDLKYRDCSHTAPVFLLFSGGVRLWERKGCCLSAAESVAERKGRVMDPLSCQEDTRRPGEVSHKLCCIVSC